MTAATIVKNSRRQAVVKAQGTGTVHANLVSLLSTVRANSGPNGIVTQTLTDAAECTITDVMFSVTGNTTITRGGTVVLTLTEGQHTFNFSQGHGFVLDEKSNANIQINFNGSNGSVILVLTKGPGFDEPDLQNLQDFQRP